MKRARFTPAAVVELEDAVRRVDRARPGWGDKLNDEVLEAIERIEEYVEGIAFPFSREVTVTRPGRALGNVAREQRSCLGHHQHEGKAKVTPGVMIAAGQATPRTGAGPALQSKPRLEAAGRSEASRREVAGRVGTREAKRTCLR